MLIDDDGDLFSHPDMSGGEPIEGSYLEILEDQNPRELCEWCLKGFHIWGFSFTM